MVVLLDTNVVSELIRKEPEPVVEAWVAGHTAENLFFTAVGEAELRFCAAILPMGQRQEAPVSVVEEMLRDAFRDRVLPFDSEAARAYAEIAAERRSVGRPISPSDCQIAAIARSRDMALATRNVRDFEGIEIEVIDPWKSE